MSILWGGHPPFRTQPRCFDGALAKLVADTSFSAARSLHLAKQHIREEEQCNQVACRACRGSDMV